MARKASKRNGDTEGSNGTPKVPPGTRLYAVGDSHGCLDQLRALHRAILRDAEKADRPAKRQVAVYLGDYVDRGPDSCGVIDLLIDEPLEGFESVHLIGNHEHFMRQFLRGEDVAPVWMVNGGVETLRSYGVDPAKVSGDSAGASELRAEFEARIPDDHRAFLDSLEFGYIEGDYAFVHAGIRPGVPLDAQDPQDVLWIREPFLESTDDHGKVIVHGHTPGPEPVVRDNRICVDTGACYGGYLTALVLEDTERRFLQV